MPVNNVTDRPLMGSLDSQIDEVERPPTSYLAVVALIIGILSLFATFGVAMFPVPIVAIAFGLLVYWKLSTDTAFGGKNLALTGFFLGILFLMWSIMANRLRNEYMYTAAGQLAKHFLETMSSGNRFETYEFTLPERERQIAGTSLEKYYNSLKSAPAREGFDSFFRDGAKTQVIESRGRQANWQFVRGAGVSVNSAKNALVSVIMSEASQQPPVQVRVQLERDTNVPRSDNVATASWIVRVVGD